MRRRVQQRRHAHLLRGAPGPRRSGRRARDGHAARGRRGPVPRRSAGRGRALNRRARSHALPPWVRRRRGPRPSGRTPSRIAPRDTSASGPESWTARVCSASSPRWTSLRWTSLRWTSPEWTRHGDDVRRSPKVRPTPSGLRGEGGRPSASETARARPPPSTHDAQVPVRGERTATPIATAHNNDVCDARRAAPVPARHSRRAWSSRGHAAHHTRSTGGTPLAGVQGSSRAATSSAARTERPATRTSATHDSRRPCQRATHGAPGRADGSRTVIACRKPPLG